MSNKTSKENAGLIAEGLITGQLNMIERAYGAAAALEVAIEMISSCGVHIIQHHGKTAAYEVLQGCADGCLGDVLVKTSTEEQKQLPAPPKRIGPAVRICVGCSECKETGRINGLQCRHCNGTKFVWITR